MTTLKSKIAKAGLGLLAGAVMFAGVSVSAMTSSQATALVNSLGITGASATALIAALTTETTTTAGATSCFTFTKTLSLGTTNSDVKELQKVLNSDADTKLAVAAGSTGSAGYESSKFGPATKAAVVKFQTKHNITPASGMVGNLTKAALNALCTTSSTTTTTTTTTTTGTTGTTQGTGAVTVALASDSPVNGTVLGGQALADITHYAFSGNGTLTQVTLNRTGISTSADISNVYLFNGNMRLTDGASVNTNGQIVFSGLNIPVNGTLDLSVKMDLNSANFSSVTLGTTLISYMVSGSTTATTVNVPGSLLYAAAAPSNSASSTLNAGSLGTTANISAGLTGYAVWSNQLQISGRSAYLKGLNLRDIGSAPIDAVQNLKLFVDGVQAGNASSVNSNNYAFFDLGSTPVTLTTGSHTIEVRGDIVKGSNRTFQFSLQNAADLMITDSQLGINIAAASAVTNGAGPTVTVLSGTVSVSVDPTFSAMTNVVGGATNAVVAKYKVHAYGENVKVQSLVITPAVTGTSTNQLNNVTLYFNGSQVGAQQQWTGTGTLTYQLGSSMVIPAGVDSILEVHADIQTNGNVNYSAGIVTVTLDGSSTSNNGQGISSLDSTIDVPSTNVLTSGLTIQTGTLSVGKNSSFASQTMSPNTNQSRIGSFTLQNQSSSEAVRITNFAVGLVSQTVGSTNYANLKITDTANSFTVNPVNPTSAGVGATSTNNFSVNYNLAPGATDIVDIWADLGSATSASATTYLTPTGMGVSSNVAIAATTATGQTITVATGSVGTPSVVTSNTTSAQNIAGGTTSGVANATKAEFNVTASNGTATISELKFVNTATSGAVTSVSVGSASAPMVSDIAYLTGLSLTVPNGGAGLNIDAMSSYSPVGSTGVTSGSQALLKLCYIKYTIGGTTSSVGATTTSASGTNCSTLTNLNTNTAISSGAQMTLVGSKPTVTLVQPTGVVVTPSATAVEVADVTISADSAGPISVTSFPLSITMSGVSTTTADFTTGAFTLKDASGNPITLATASSTTGVNACTSTTTCTGASTVTFASPYTISAGTSQTFRVFIPTGAGAVSTGTLPNVFINTNMNGSGNFSWTDIAGGAGSATNEAGNATSHNIYNYPTGTVSVHN